MSQGMSEEEAIAEAIRRSQEGDHPPHAMSEEEAIAEAIRRSQEGAPSHDEELQSCVSRGLAMFDGAGGWPADAQAWLRSLLPQGDVVQVCRGAVDNPPSAKFVFGKNYERNRNDEAVKGTIVRMLVEQGASARLRAALGMQPQSSSLAGGAAAAAAVQPQQARTPTKPVQPRPRGGPRPHAGAGSGACSGGGGVGNGGGELQQFLRQYGAAPAHVTALLEGSVTVDGKRYALGSLGAPAAMIGGSLETIAVVAATMPHEQPAERGGGSGGGGGGGGGSIRGGGSGGATEQVIEDGGGGARPDGFEGRSAPIPKADGTLGGATAMHVAQPEDAPSVLDGNYFRGKAWNEVIRQPDKPVGPRQLAPQERVTLADRMANLAGSGVTSTTSAGGARNGGGGGAQHRAGTRVAMATTERAYEIDGYEREVWIDPQRELTSIVGKDEGLVERPEKPADLEAAVMFETAGGLAGKINNAHLMGGERVKELDFFVATVRTPAVVVLPPDPAVAVAQLALQTQLPVAASPATGSGDGTAVPLFVQKEHLEKDGSVAPTIAGYAAALHFIVTTIVTELLGGDGASGMIPLSRVRFTYFATMRADACVAAKSEVSAPGSALFTCTSFPISTRFLTH